MKKKECGVSRGIRCLLNKYLLVMETILLIVFGFSTPIFANSYNGENRLKKI